MFRTATGSILCAAMLCYPVMAAGQASAQPTIDGKAVVCDTFGKYGVNVKSVKWIGDYIIDQLNQTPSGAVTTIQVAITAYCPNYQPAFDELNRQLAKNQHPGNPLYN